MSPVDMEGEPLVDAPDGAPPVRGALHRATAGERSGGLVLTHGAGSDANHPLLIALGTAFAAKGVTVLRCDLPFRQARRTGPPTGRGDVDREGLRRAVGVLRDRLPAPATARVCLGGHSYGGRQASMLVAEPPGVADALLLLSYPLHPPRKPSELRVAHFPALRTPAMFVHGSRDPFGTVDEIRDAVGVIPAVTSLVVLDGAGHDLSSWKGSTGSRAPKRDRGTALRDLAEMVAEKFLDWLATAASG